MNDRLREAAQDVVDARERGTFDNAINALADALATPPAPTEDADEWHSDRPIQFASAPTEDATLDVERLARLLHAEFITHEMGKGAIDDNCALCDQRAVRLTAEGVGFARVSAPITGSDDPAQKGAS